MQVLLNTEYHLNVNRKIVILWTPLKTRSQSFIAWHVEKVVFSPSGKRNIKIWTKYQTRCTKGIKCLQGNLLSILSFEIISKTCTAQIMKFSIKDLFSKCDQICSFLVTFIEEILNGKLRFLCNVEGRKGMKQKRMQNKRMQIKPTLTVKITLTANC